MLGLAVILLLSVQPATLLPGLSKLPQWSDTHLQTALAAVRHGGTWNSLDKTDSAFASGVADCSINITASFRDFVNLLLSVLPHMRSSCCSSPSPSTPVVDIAKKDTVAHP